MTIFPSHLAIDNVRRCSSVFNLRTNQSKAS